MPRTRQEAKLRGWLEALPDEVVQARPVLSVYFAGALLMSGELEGVEDRLRDAERWLEPATGDRAEPLVPSAEMVVADEEEYRRLPATIELYRAGQALARGDAPGTVRHAQRAIELAREDDHLSRASAAALLGLVYWGSGDLEAGHGPTPRAWRACGGPGTLPIRSAARSRWRTSGARKAVSARRCAPSSRHCSSQLSKAGQCCGEPRTCTWA